MPVCSVRIPMLLFSLVTRIGTQFCVIMYSRSVFTLWLKILSIKIRVDTSFIHKGYLQRLLHSLIIITSDDYFFNYAFKNHPVEALSSTAFLRT